MSALPLFPVTTVGSWPRPAAVLDAQRQFRGGRITRASFDAVADAAIRDVVQVQEDAGCDIVTDGELRRDNFYSFVAHKLAGVRLMTLAEMLDIVEDKAGFERLLETLDVPAYAISTAVCIGRIERRDPLVADDLRFVQRHTDRPVKATLPGPYLLTRAMFVAEATRATYDTKEALADDVVRVLRDEVIELARAGAAVIQLDEPVLSEVAFAPGQTRTFMCGALAARKDPAEELAFAVCLINRVFQGLTGFHSAVHVCRGNWSRNEATLLRGSYAALAPYLDQLHVDQLVLEYATERAGDLVRFEGKELGLGVVNPRTDSIESEIDIRRAIDRALKDYPPERLSLNPDCGFGTFSNRPMNSAAVAAAKLRAIVGAARAVRG
jgi:5-methyltetrahydropteroyltriglutamate--homocysteine methyltransferase